MKNCISSDLSPCRTHSTIPFHHSIPPFQSSDCRLPSPSGDHSVGFHRGGGGGGGGGSVITGLDWTGLDWTGLDWTGLAFNPKN